MYSISKEETPEKHLAVCNLLAFGEPLLDDIYTLINWHINRTLSLFPAFTPIKSFAVYIFFHCPDSPISLSLIHISLGKDGLFRPHAGKERACEKRHSGDRRRQHEL